MTRTLWWWVVGLVMLLCGAAVGAQEAPEPLLDPPGVVSDGGPALRAVVLTPGAQDGTLDRFPVEPGSVTAVQGLVGMFRTAVRDRNWTLVAGLALMVTVWLSRRAIPWVKRQDPRWLPLLSLVASSVPALALALMRPDVSWDEILSGMVTIWLLAAGSWDSVMGPVRDLAAHLAPRIWKKPADNPGVTQAVALQPKGEP